MVTTLVQSLNGISAPATGTPLLFVVPHSIFAMQTITVGVPSGGQLACELVMEATMDEINWATIQDLNGLPAVSQIFAANNGQKLPVMGIRARLVSGTFAPGQTLTVWIAATT